MLIEEEILCLINIGFPSNDAERIIKALSEDDARVLQNRVGMAYDDCVAYLHEELTEERTKTIWVILQRLQPYPTIRGQLECWIRSLAPDSGLVPKNPQAG